MGLWYLNNRCLHLVELQQAIFLFVRSSGKPPETYIDVQSVFKKYLIIQDNTYYRSCNSTASESTTDQKSSTLLIDPPNKPQQHT